MRFYRQSLTGASKVISKSAKIASRFIFPRQLRPRKGYIRHSSLLYTFHDMIQGHIALLYTSSTCGISPVLITWILTSSALITTLEGPDLTEAETIAQLSAIVRTIFQVSKDTQEDMAVLQRLRPDVEQNLRDLTQDTVALACGAQAVVDREVYLRECEFNLTHHTQAIREREVNLSTRERILDHREQVLIDREFEIISRERNLALQEREIQYSRAQTISLENKARQIHADCRELQKKKKLGDHYAKRMVDRAVKRQRRMGKLTQLSMLKLIRDQEILRRQKVGLDHEKKRQERTQVLKEVLVT